jgi:hypothetical protein
VEAMNSASSASVVPLWAVSESQRMSLKLRCFLRRMSLIGLPGRFLSRVEVYGFSSDDRHPRAWLRASRGGIEELVDTVQSNMGSDVGG